MKHCLRRLPELCGHERRKECVSSVEETRARRYWRQVAHLGFNYLGEMNTEQTADGGFLDTSTIPVDPALSARNNYGNDISLNTLVKGGKFGLDVAYNSGIYFRVEYLARRSATNRRFGFPVATIPRKMSANCLVP